MAIITSPTLREGKIALRIVGNNLGGGARRYCYMLNRALLAAGYPIHTFIPRGPLPDPYSDQEKVGLPYTNTRNWVLVLLILLAKVRRVSYVHLHLRNVVIIFGPACRWLGIPTVITVHAPVSGSPSLVQRLYRSLYRTELLRANLVLYVSAFVRLDVERTLGMNPQPSHYIVDNGSDDPYVCRYRADASTLRICVVGELTERKGIRDILQIISLLNARVLHNGIHINFYGSGPLSNIVEASALASANVRVVLHGYKENLDDIFLHNDVHLMMAHQEAFGRVVTEAMSYGIPSLTSRSGAFPELLAGEECGWLCEDAAHAADLLFQLARKPDEVARKGVAARARFEERYTSAIWAAKTMEKLKSNIQLVAG